MSPVTVNFGYTIPGSDPIIGAGPAVPLTTWQKAAISADLQLLHDNFQISYGETGHGIADIEFGAALFDFNAQPSTAFALSERVGNQLHIWFGADRTDFNNPEVFQHAAAKAIAQALTLPTTSNGPTYSGADNLSPYPYPGKGLFTIDEIVGLGTKFGTNFHLATGDRVVAELYLGVFGRMPDAGGLAVQVNAFHSGVSLASLANAFLSTAEGIDTFGTDRSGGSFVERLYQSVLGRQPDLGGESAQVYALQHGTSAGQLVVNLIQSAEFQARIHGDFLFT